MTTAVLRPTGLTAIDLIPAGDPKTEDYVLQNAPDLKEQERMEIAYSEGANLDGGEAVSYHGPLVTLPLDVAVHGVGVSEDAAKQQLLQYVQALEAAVCNTLGGTFEYKPDGLGAGVRSTFYHYIQSQPPKLRATTNNDWDAAPVETEPNYVCALELEIELQTQPYALSDLASPVAVKTATTVYNQDDGQVGYVTIAAADVKGTVEALTQLRIRNLVAGTWAAIGKLWYARRTKGTLANFAPIFEGGTADADSTIHWSTEADTTRRSDNFLRYAPPEAANDLWAYRYFSIANITDHEGKVAIAVVVRSLAETRAAWDLKATLQVADVIVETGVKNVATVGGWTVCILGELDIPPTPISDDESYATNLYIYFRRTTGDENQAIDLDFGTLLYVDEYVQQVTIPDGYTDSYRLLLENLGRELCHVVAQDTLALEKVAEPLCPLLKLRPGKDNRLDFIWERLGRTYEILVDDFEDYEAWHWLKVADFEDDEAWDQPNSSTHFFEGEEALFADGGLVGVLVTPLDLSGEGRFTDDDYTYLAVYIVNYASMLEGSYVMIVFRDSTMKVAQCLWMKAALTEGGNFLKVKRSDLAIDPGFDWSDIGEIWVALAAPHPVDAYFDDWRIVKADPDDATKGNDTGTIWDFIRDVWHIYELDSADKTLGCIDITAALEQVALIHEEPPANIKYLAQVRAKRDNGDVGLVFRCVDGTSGSEDMAAFFIDTTNDQLELRKWAAGAASDIATAVAQVTAPDVDYWLGVWMIGNRVRCYFGTSKAAIWNAETKEFVASARKFNATDSVFASGGALPDGQAGLLSIGTLGRFDDVELYGVGDGHVPGDTVQVEVNAIYRTIYPFRE